jgi:Methylase involved in ubiquinone/menaquinone biosynthesis
MARFADHFSPAAAEYAAYRPHYPDALFHWLASAASDRRRAWDCGTGSGQAAVALATHFDHVLASDPSIEQLTHAARAPGVRYVAMTAEQPALADGCMALITVAQALHWFRRTDFFAEATRVLAPGGVLAVWRYGLLTIDAEVDVVIERFYRATVGAYWPPERALIEQGDAHLHFPFDELSVPTFVMDAQWTLPQLAGYLSTWSAVARYRAATGRDPLPALVTELRSVWPRGDESRAVRWPLEVRAGRRRGAPQR